MYRARIRLSVVMAAWVTAFGVGCGQREPTPPAAPVTPVAPTAPVAAQPPAAAQPGPASAPAKAETDPYDRLLRELAVAREPGIYFTLKKLEKPELQPYLAKAHADPQQRAQVSNAIFKLALADNSTAMGIMHVWIIPEQLPPLIEYLEKRNKLRQEIIRALAEIKDPRSVEAIAKHFPKLRDSCSAAFVKLGGDLCGNAVLPHLYYPDQGVAKEAQRLSVLFKVDANLILDQTLREVNGDEPKRRAVACEWLLKGDPKQPRRAEIAKALEPHIAEKAADVNRRALPALLKFADADNVPSLVAYLDDVKNTYDRKSVLLYLGNSKDPRAVTVVVRELDTSNKTIAAQAVKSMGPIAETAVAKYLEHELPAMRNEAAKLLQVVGTQASVPALQRAANDKQGTVQANAKKALRQIAERSK